MREKRVFFRGVEVVPVMQPIHTRLIHTPHPYEPGKYLNEGYSLVRLPPAAPGHRPSYQVIHNSKLEVRQ